MIQGLLYSVGLGEHPAKTQGKKRSPKWRSVRAEHLKSFPSCEVCGVTTNITVHHVIPFHVAPDRELDPSNLVTLCESAGMQCHITFGHLGDYRSYNPQCIDDVTAWRAKVQARP